MTIKHDSKAGKFFHLLKVILTILLIIVATDVLFQIMYRIVKGNFTWDSIVKHEVFIVDFLKPVDDERYLIPKADYTSESTKFNEYGFRAGKNTESKKDPNIVFLGDSVLFGTALQGSETIPSQFSEIYFKETSSRSSVINAALPSFSLNQIVYKYIYEVVEKFPVEGIVLQAYDPAQSFYALSHEWDVTRNWYTGSARYNLGFVKRFINTPAKYSSLFYLYWRFSGAYFTPPQPYKQYTENDIERYRQSITNSLDVLVSNAKDADYIILLPIIRPKTAYNLITESERTPIDILNKEFESYAKSHDKVHFLDTTPLLYGYDEKEVFLDTCCHLTAKGASLEAKFIYDYIQKLKKP